MERKHNVLILGASYGSLFATKLAMAGHTAQLVCLPDEVDLINSEGAIVKMPIGGREGLTDIRTTDLSGSVSACGSGPCTSGGIRPRRTCHARAPVSVQRHQESAWPHRGIGTTLLVDHEYASTTLPEKNSRP